MFYGKEIKKLDEKGRLSLKRNQIRYLGDRPFAKKQGNRFMIYPEQLEKEFKPFQIWKMKFDNQGRLSIPAKLLYSIGAWKEVILIGCGDHLEIHPQRRISWEKITIKEAEKLYQHGVTVTVDSDRKEVILNKESSTKREG